MRSENTAVKKEPRAHNRYTGKRAQNVAWVRDYLHQRLEDKVKRGHVLGREMLIACKWPLIIEGVPVDRALAKMDQKEPKPDAKAKQPIKLPQLLKTLQIPRLKRALARLRCRAFVCCWRLGRLVVSQHEADPD